MAGNRQPAKRNCQGCLASHELCSNYLLFAVQELILSPVWIRLIRNLWLSVLYACYISVCMIVCIVLGPISTNKTSLVIINDLIAL